MSVNLCIDWGNTNIKAAIFENDKVTKLYAIQPEKLIVEISKIIETHNPQKAILCSVVNHGVEIEKILKSKTISFINLDSQTRLPINNAYLSSDTLGADRIAMAAGAWAQFPEKNNLVICLGTCITYNFITKNKTFRGGLITPGLQMRLRAMHNFTDRLPDVKVSGEILLLGYDTESGMRSGTVLGITCEIDGFIKEFESQYPEINAILTGGDAGFFAKKIKSKIFAEPDLLLKGLNLILNYNVPIPH